MTIKYCFAKWHVSGVQEQKTFLQVLKREASAAAAAATTANPNKVRAERKEEKQAPLLLPCALIFDSPHSSLPPQAKHYTFPSKKHTPRTTPKPTPELRLPPPIRCNYSSLQKRHWSPKVGSVMSTLLLFLLLLSGVSFSSCIRIGNGGYEEWRLGTATYIKESQGHPLNDGGGACGYGDLDIFRYGRYTAGLSSALFVRGSACGGCYELRCVNNILWCLRGSPTVVVTATDFCAPNFGLPDDFGGWCNFPREHFEMSEASFLRVAKAKADIVPVQFRRVSCDRAGGMRFTITGSANFLQVLITNVAADGEVVAVKVKGSRTGWIPMGRNWGQNWQCDADLRGQPLSFEVTGGKGRTITSYNVAPSDWMFAQTFQGKQFAE